MKYSFRHDSIDDLYITISLVITIKSSYYRILIYSFLPFWPDFSSIISYAKSELNTHKTY